MKETVLKAPLFTLMALIAFAANSLLCRMAFVGGYIDPWHFTVIRLLSGALCLGLIILIHSYIKRQQTDQRVAHDPHQAPDTGSWLSSMCLVVYALCFSVAYMALQTGTGALILFSAVQLTMIGWGIYKKERLSPLQWLALSVAIIGFVYLMLPSAVTPSLPAALMMSISGIAWGIYSIRGKSCVAPLRATGYNFMRSLLILPLLLLLGFSQLGDVRIEGVLLASASGAIASGIGYSIWYVAMPLLKSTTAAIVQLCVPILAAVMGALFLFEPLTLRFLLSSTLILGAVLVFILGKNTANPLS